MPYNPNLREEELKNTIAQDLFAAFDCTQIIGNIDFAVALKKDKNQTELFENEYLLWAEAKRGTSDLEKSLTQLILTIGKAKTYAQSAPKFLGCFDAEKIAFIEFYKIQHFFAQNDFNWQVTPSDTTTKEFLAIYQKVQEIIDGVWFRYDDKDLPKFIKQNFVIKKNDISKIKIDKNNFLSIFYKWEKDVFPTIGVELDKLKSENVISGDFYLADLLSDGNKTIVEKLSVLLKEDLYKLQKEDNIGLIFREIRFRDNQKAHTQFWNRYERPPKEEYQEYIRTRRDLLVPVDIRERKGAFFTPQIWVEKSQQYLAQTLGENWQEDHYIWDCCAGTGNLLFGLNNKRNIYASTLDDQDVNIMKQNANLFEDHVFQFDFLNDDFSRLPEGLRQIIADPEKRKKLVVYINPPYAEAMNAKEILKTGAKAKTGVSKGNKTYEKYSQTLGTAARELFVQFFIRIYKEIPGCVLAEFSKLKILQAPNFAVFRKVFRAKLEKIFLMPSWTFDNVNGKFPIGFYVWNTDKKEDFSEIVADVYNQHGQYTGTKLLFTHTGKYINDWRATFVDEESDRIGYLIRQVAPDFQNNSQVAILSKPQAKQCMSITANNLIHSCIYIAVRHCIEATWLNDRDQFLFPNDGWKSDPEFQTDCLIFTLFHGQNRITSEQGTNHWIPFSEDQVGAKKAFKSDFMFRFLCGKIKPSNQPSGFLDFESNSSDEPFVPSEHFSAEANDLLAAGKALWKYYFEQPVNNVDASLYDIRKYFQGINPKTGRMNSSSNDEHYNNLRSQLSKALKNLANKISQKVFLYGFLK